MKKLRLISLFSLALVFCFTLTASVSALDTTYSVENESTSNVKLYTFEVSNASATLISRSSVSGYNQKTLTSGGSNNGIFIDCNGSGRGGMGITIETSCSQGTYTIDYVGNSSIGYASAISGQIKTNDHVEYNNLTQSDLSEYYIAFDIPDGVSMFVKVWIYG